MTRGSLGRLRPLPSSGLLSLSLSCLVLPPLQAKCLFFPRRGGLGGLDSSEPKSQSQVFL